MPKVTIDGRTVEVAPGTMVIEAAKEAGIEIPHFCWHEALTPSGNCRICLVETKMPKGPPPKGPVIACMTAVADGMEVQTQSEGAVEGRKAVMEFLLLNHPLDCPICDQAGECKLQRYSFNYGWGKSNLEDEKVKKPKNREFSDKVTFDAERCILCTRCVRFFEDVRDKSELGLMNRGTYNEISVADGEQLTDPYQMNIIDICPVGALTSTDFRFQSRVWFLEQTDSVCTGCATGCNIQASSRDGQILRFVPRKNEAVNGHWMCDAGRLSYKDVHAEDRIDRPWIRMGGELEEVDWREALDRAGDLLAGAKGPVTFVASTRASNEDLWMFRKLSERFDGAVLRRATPTGEGDDFLLQADRTPNAAGASLVGWPEEAFEGAAGGLVVLGDDLAGAALPEDREFLVVLGWRLRELAQAADVVLPLAGFAEVDQTYVNSKKRLQKAPVAVPAPGEALAGHVVFPALERRLAKEVPGYRAADDAFRAMVADVEGLGMVPARRIHRIDPLGLDLAEGTAV